MTETIEFAEKLARRPLEKYRSVLREDHDRLWSERVEAIVDGVISLDDAPDILTACARLANEATATLEARRRQTEPRGLYIDTTVEWIDLIHTCLAALTWSRETDEGLTAEHVRHQLLRCGAIADWWTQQSATGDGD